MTAHIYSFLMVLSMSVCTTPPLLAVPAKASALKLGDTIALVAPARPVDTGDLSLIVRAIKQRGFKVLVADNLTSRRGYLAGTDEERAKEFMKAWCNPDVKMVWSIGGGYGSMRILELLDFQKMKKFKKIFVGMSDITAMHCAFHKELDLVTFLGPMPIKLYAGDKDSAARNYALENLWQMLKGNTVLPPYPYGYTVPAKTLKAGKAKGRLVGGNLALISSLAGTRWQLNTEGKVLLLEDVNEEPYRVDRMLRQLKQAGMLDKPAAVVLATWEQCHAKQPSLNLTLDQVFEDYFKNAPYPVFVGFPSGHIEGQLTLPLNAMVEVDAGKRQLVIAESIFE